MKTVLVKPLKKSQGVDGKGFNLVELLVLLGVIAVLITLQLPALAGGKSQTRIGMCASHVQQIALACQIYANENNDRLPVLALSGSWAWDVPASQVNALLNSGAQTNTFYCPGTAPRFTDLQNWSGPDNTTLWGYGLGGANPFHTIGYALTFSGSASRLAPTNVNTTIQPERISDLGLGTSYIVPASERVLVADATLSSGSTLPGYLHPENNYVSIMGGFQWNGASYPHVSPHLKGNVPVGGNLGFKDGHVDWRRFELMTIRSASGATFWW